MKEVTFCIALTWGFDVVHFLGSCCGGQPVEHARAISTDEDVKSAVVRRS